MKDRRYFIASTLQRKAIIPPVPRAMSIVVLSLIQCPSVDFGQKDAKRSEIRAFPFFLSKLCFQYILLYITIIDSM